MNGVSARIDSVFEQSYKKTNCNQFSGTPFINTIPNVLLETYCSGRLVVIHTKATYLWEMKIAFTCTYMHIFVGEINSYLMISKIINKIYK